MPASERVATERAAMGHAIIVVGASLGGMQTLGVVLSALADDFAIPIAVVLHRHISSGELLRKSIKQHTRLEVLDAQDKQPIDAGVFLAPAGYHLLVERGWFGLSLDAPVCHARPSIDVLFESAAKAYGSRVAAVVLTGANEDGACGTACVRRHGGVVVAQDPNTAEARRMPEAAIAAGADLTLSPAGIAQFLSELHRALP